MRVREQLQRVLPGAFLVLAAQAQGLLPHRGLNDLDRDGAERDGGLDRPARAPIFEAAASALFRKCLGPLNEGVSGSVPAQPLLQRENVNPFLRAGADYGHVGGIDQARGAIAELDDGEPAADAGIYAKRAD